MTTATGACAARGAIAPMGFEVYFAHRGPSPVAAAAGKALMVLVTVHGSICVDLRGLAALEPAPTSGG
jgi:hypothetical protein